jgi:uncharacterized RDD family membrane protein YckC
MPPGAGYTPQANTGYVEIPGRGVVKIATIGQRFLARLVDAVLYIVVGIILFAVGVASITSSTTTDADGVRHTTNAGFFGFFVVIAIGTIAGLLYEWLFIAFKGATLGKMALGLRVVAQDGSPQMGLGKALIRQLIPAAAGFFCFLLEILVYLSPLFDGTGRMQGWHDKAATDLVISLK